MSSTITMSEGAICGKVGPLLLSPLSQSRIMESFNTSISVMPKSPPTHIVPYSDPGIITVTSSSSMYP